MPERETDYRLFKRLEQLVAEIDALLEPHRPLLDKEVVLEGLSFIPKLGLVFSEHHSDAELVSTEPHPVICAPNGELIFDECTIHRELTHVLWADYHQFEKSAKWEVNKTRRGPRYFNEAPVVDGLVQMGLARIPKAYGDMPPGPLLYAFLDTTAGRCDHMSQLTIEKVNLRLQWFETDYIAGTEQDDARFKGRFERAQIIYGLNSAELLTSKSQTP